MTIGRVVHRGSIGNGDSTGTTTSISLTPSGSTLVGDTLVLVWTMAQSQLAAALSYMASSLPAWTVLNSSSQGTTVGSIIGAKKAVAGDDNFANAYTLTVSSAFRQSAAMCSIGLLDLATLVATPRAETVSGTSHATPSGVASADNTVVLTAISQRNNTTNFSWTPPAGYELYIDDEFGGSNATTSTAVAGNLTPLSSGSSYGGANWTGGRTAETSVVTWTITGRPTNAEAFGLTVI